jgi:type IV secretory pathway VirJ component
LRKRQIARARLAMALAVSLVLGWAPSALATPERISHGRFENVVLYRPTAPVRSVVLLLSDADGWTGDAARIATMLTTEGALVAGIATPPVLASFSSDGSTCVYPDGDLENLSHWLQGYAHLPTYFPPVVVGSGAGGALAYTALVRAPTGTFAGVLSLAFCPHLAMTRPPCPPAPAMRAGRRGIDLTPSARTSARWIVLRGEGDHACPLASVASFVERTHGAKLVRVPGTGRTLPTTPHATATLLAAFRTLAASAPASIPPPPSALTDLPLIEVAANGDDPRFAVLLSGDGGWAGLDKDVAAALAARGIPVVGWDSLRYFWTARTPNGLAADLDRVLRFYADAWHRTRVLVIGYSQGADVLPFALNRLPSASRALVTRVALLSLGERASFEFHVGNWIGNDDEDGLAIRPEAERLSAATTLCVYGADETDSLCPRLGGSIRPLPLPGGHHFDGDYDALVGTILATGDGTPESAPGRRTATPP